MPFPGEPKPWHKKIGIKKVQTAAAEIAASVAALKQRREELGGAKAFDPSDGATNAAFNRLWVASFDQHYDPSDQARILNALHLRHRGAIEDMRAIGYASERRMELGYADKAIRTADGIKDTALIDEWERVRAQGYEKSRRYERAVERDDQQEAEAAKHDMENFLPQFDALLTKRREMLDRITGSFPYPTYELLASTEAVMLKGLTGITPERILNESHLFVEAGALPLTAVNHVLNRRFMHAVCTISDEESFYAARAFVRELERLGVLEEGRVFVLHLSPQDPNFVYVLQGNECGFHSATISQLVQGKEEVTKVAEKLIDKENGLGIDTIITRGADGLVQMLYEPLDDMLLPSGVRKRMTNRPVHASLQPPPDGGVEFHHTFPCYNTSHVYSSRAVLPDFNPGDEIALFRGKAADKYKRPGA